LRVFRARREEEGITLSDLDVAILKCLEKRGGYALQSELQKDLPTVPRTTLWRHVKKFDINSMFLVALGVYLWIILLRRVKKC
jgi:hypothetical protein